MGLRYMVSVFLYLCAFLTRKCSSQNIASGEPEQGSQICNVFLVSGKYGVPDDHISASSIYTERHAAKYSRLNTTFVDGKNIGAWSAYYRDIHQYIEVELNRMSLIRAVVTQGRNGTGDTTGSDQFVTRFKVSYSTDRIKWRFVKDISGNRKLFPGNTDQNSIWINDIKCPFEARYIRIHPWEFHNHPSMRFDIIGCLLTEVNSTTDCGFENGLCGWTQETKMGFLSWKREILSIQREFPEPCAVNCTIFALTPTYGTNSDMTWQPGNLMIFIQRSSMSRCLRVLATATTTDGAYLNLTSLGCVTHAAVGRSVVGILNEHEWTPVEVDVRSNDHHLIINGGWENGRKGFLAIDSISMINGYCPDCDFKDDLCNWNNTGSVNWKLSTEGSRNFISAEVLQKETDSARLIGPVINGSESKTGQTCLRFSYSISGSLRNKLSVYLNINGTRNLLWKNAAILHGWIMQYVNITSGYDFQIEFEGKMGFGSLDVDDVIVLYSHCPVVPVSNFPTDTRRSRRTNNNIMQMYTGIGVGVVVAIVTLAIVMVYVLRRRKRITNPNMEEIRPDDIRRTKNVAEVEYAILIKTYVTPSARKLKMDSEAIYENQCKPEMYLSTQADDQTYDHVPPDEKIPNLKDETYDHATLWQKVSSEENHNISTVLPNPTTIDTEDGDAEDDVTYSNVTIGFKLST